MILQENAFCTEAQGMAGTQHLSLLHRMEATTLLHVSSEIKRCRHQRHLSRPSLAVGWRDVRLLSGCRAALERTWIVYFQVQPSASPFPTEYPPFSGAPGAPVSVRRGKSMETKAEKPGAACQVMCGLGLTAAYWLECDYLAPIGSHSIFSTPVSCDIIFTVLLS